MPVSCNARKFGKWAGGVSGDLSTLPLGSSDFSIGDRGLPQSFAVRSASQGGPDIPDRLILCHVRLHLELQRALGGPFTACRAQGEASGIALARAASPRFTGARHAEIALGNGSIFTP